MLVRPKIKITAGMISAARAAAAGGQMPAGYKLVHTAIILQEGWEMDNRLWVIDGPQGRFSATTSHGGIRVPADVDLDEEIAKHQEALASLVAALNLLRC